MTARALPPLLALLLLVPLAGSRPIRDRASALGRSRAGALGAQHPSHVDAVQEPERRSPTLDSARARWERFTPEQKERARERYERFLAMSEEERVQLVESARSLRQRAERVQGELAKEARERLDAMDPEKRRTLLGEIVAAEAREVGARVRARFPEDWLELLERARPEDRARMLRQFQLQQRDRVARYAIGELGKRLGLAAVEIDRMQRLPGEERARAVLDLRKRLSERQVDESGLPPGISPEQWEAWLALPPEEFFEVLQRYRQSRMWSERPAATPPGARTAEEIEAKRALLEAARPRPEETLALADLAPEERAARLAAAKRGRCVEAIRTGRLLPPGEIEALGAMSDREFFQIVRHLVGPPRRAQPRMDGASPAQR